MNPRRTTYNVHHSLLLSDMYFLLCTKHCLSHSITEDCESQRSTYFREATLESGPYEASQLV